MLIWFEYDFEETEFTLGIVNDPNEMQYANRVSKDSDYGYVYVGM